jgi:citrate synthase
MTGKEKKMEEVISAKNIGLRGVKVADTKISDVDGERGNLIYRGYHICDLASHSTFEEVSYLLLIGDLPTSEALKTFKEGLISERAVPQTLHEWMKKMPSTTQPMDVLQAAIPILAGYDPELRDETKEANLRKALRLIAKVPNVVASWERIRKGLDPMAPSSDLNHAGNFLYMLSGIPPTPEIARDFDICLILHAEHSFNASTFAGREVASTRAHLYASVAAAVGALSGELHGGANSEVMRMLNEIAEVERVRSWVSQRLRTGGRIMGMGHAVYRTEDPRATILRGIAKNLANRTGNPKWFELSQAIEEATKEEFRRLKGREIYCNVDFYSASVYHMMGIPTDLFTPVFAVSRISGWAAHIIEEKFAEAQPKPELYRPDADYVGNYCGPQACEYIPIEKRHGY